MRIVHVVPALTIGGIWRHLQAASALPSGSFTNVVVSLFDADSAVAISALQLDVQRLKIAPTLYKEESDITDHLKDVIEGLGADIVHSHHFFSDVYAIKAAYQAGKPAIRTVHGITQISYSNPFARDRILTDWSGYEIERQMRLEEFCAATLVVSADLRNKLIKKGFSPHKVRTLSYGVDLNAFRAVEWEQSRIGRGSTPWTVGFIGRLEPVKNPEMFIDVASRSVRARLPLRFRMVGGGRLESKLLRDVNHLGIEKFVDMRPEQADILPEFQEVDLLLLTSVSEGLPIVVLEAMAAGVPVIATSVGGVGELIEHRISGFLCQPHDVEGMIALLAELVAHPRKLQNVRQEAQNVICRQFSLTQHIKNLAAVYNSVLE